MTACSHLSPNARRLVDRALLKAKKAGASEPALNHWLMSALEEYGGVISRLTSDDWVQATRARVEQELARAEFGEVIPAEELVDNALTRADERGESRANVTDLVLAVLVRVGTSLVDDSVLAVSQRKIPLEEALQGRVASTGAEEAAGEHCVSPSRRASRRQGKDAAGTKSRTKTPVAEVATPFLDKFGRDLTAEALANKLRPIVGRDAEVKACIEVLCRTTKRCPILIGPAGAGKTAIAEGIAYQVAHGDVPAPLRDVRVVAIEMSAIFAGATWTPDIQERMRDVVREGSQPGVVVFLDEAHALLSSDGGRSGAGDILKPALARGEIALIAATTDDEYRRFIKPDRALSRRLQPISVAEMSRSDTLAVLKSHRDRLKDLRGVVTPDHVLDHLVFFAEENMRDRTFPDKAIELLEQTVAHAVASKKESVDESDATEVLSRLIGRTFSAEEAIGRLVTEIREAGLTYRLPVDRIVRRLDATLRGWDLRSWRPNLVLALGGSAAENSQLIASLFARALYGSDDRVLEIDLSPVKDEASITLLVGSPPAYVGFERALPIHRLATTPGLVVRIAGAHACHPSAALFVAEAIDRGYFADGSNNRYYLSDCVVMIEIADERGTRKRQPLGFGDRIQTASKPVCHDVPGSLAGSVFADHVDIEIPDLGSSDQSAGERWLVRPIAAAVIERYRRSGILLELDESATDHLAAASLRFSNQKAFERFAEEWLSEVVLQSSTTSSDDSPSALKVTVTNGEGRVETIRQAGDAAPRCGRRKGEKGRGASSERQSQVKK